MCDYGDPVQFWLEKPIKKARKVHECCECSSDIDPGESYMNCFSVLDGVGETFKFCDFCWGKRHENHDLLYECAIGSMWDVLVE